MCRPLYTVQQLANRYHQAVAGQWSNAKGRLPLNFNYALGIGIEVDDLAQGMSARAYSRTFSYAVVICR
jgi:hypothetical protein